VLNVMQFPLVALAASESFKEIQRQLAVYRLRFGHFGNSSAGGGRIGQASHGASASAAAATSSCHQGASSGAGAGAGGGRGFSSGPLSTPSECALSSTLSTPQPLSAASAATSPYSSLLAAEAQRRTSSLGQLMPAAERQVRRETVRSTGICAHFWALFLSFGCGLLLARGDHFIAHCAWSISSFLF